MFSGWHGDHQRDKCRCDTITTGQIPWRYRSFVVTIFRWYDACHIIRHITSRHVGVLRVNAKHNIIVWYNWNRRRWRGWRRRTIELALSQLRINWLSGPHRCESLMRFWWSVVITHVFKTLSLSSSTFQIGFPLKTRIHLPLARSNSDTFPIPAFATTRCKLSRDVEDMSHNMICLRWSTLRQQCEGWSC